MRRTRVTMAGALAVSVLVVGLPVAASAAPKAATPAADIPVQLLAMNDFHGRISETTGGDSELVVGPGPDGMYGDPDPENDEIEADDETVVVGGAANIASAVHRARSAFVGEGGEEQASFFVGAGDLVSASPYNSSVFKDEPTIEVLNAMGLDVSSVGNHEYDRGTEELRRISAATDGSYSDDVSACPETLGGEPFVEGEDGCFGEGRHAFEGAEFPIWPRTSSWPARRTPLRSRCSRRTRSSTWATARSWRSSASSPTRRRPSSLPAASRTSPSSTRRRRSTAGSRSCRSRASRRSVCCCTRARRTRGGLERERRL
ncbi:hypothetical protein [Blastococcus brunescens]|uniref:Calcineurin-like phosphoesterase domain-containing protein n=1 Tax=Blastococcus brunescens TaxID=1564165 RepID=A0ABZ1AVW7_9ACTN|nr:hypothetical protein [Blastococcus sp. BMG 8361]WRL62645.1 hypothetical protein U6N30_22240 [Blastococcus sp. BMG 8361]